MANDYRAYTSACKVHTCPIYPCKYLQIRSIECCYFRKQYLTVLVLIRPYIDCFENVYISSLYYSWFNFLKVVFMTVTVIL